jgi:integrase
MASGSVIRYDGKRGTVWRLKYVDAAGRQVMETVGREADGVTEKTARELLERRRVEVRDGLRKPAVVNFAEAADRWFASERVARSWKRGTASQYRHWADDLSHYFRGPVAAIRERHCVEYRDWALRESSYRSPSSVNSRLTVLGMILRWAKKNELRPDVPALEYAKVRQRKGTALKPEQVRVVLRSFDDAQARAVFLTLVTTGLRSGELRALRWRDVDLIENRLRVEDSKTETGERSIALGKALAEELWQHRRRTAFSGEEEYVFCHPELGSRYRMDPFGEELRRAFKKAGLPFPAGFRRCHDLRVTAGTNDVMAGMSPAKLQQKLGHTNFRVTQRYVNLAGVVFADEAEALEARLLGAPVESSTDLSESEITPGDGSAWNSAESASTD